MSGKSFQVLFQHFNSLLPKVSAGEMKCFVFPLKSVRQKKKGEENSEGDDHWGCLGVKKSTPDCSTSPYEISWPRPLHLVLHMRMASSLERKFWACLSSLPRRENLQRVPNMLLVLWLSFSLKATTSCQDELYSSSCLYSWFTAGGKKNPMVYFQNHLLSCPLCVYFKIAWCRVVLSVWRR